MVVAVPLVLAGLLLGEPAVVLLLTATAAALTAVLAREHPRLPTADACACAGAAAGGFAAALYVLGFPAAVTLLMVLVATSPAALRATRRASRSAGLRSVRRRKAQRAWRTAARRRSARPRLRKVAGVEDPGALSVDTLTGMVRALDDRALCRAWRASWEVLTETAATVDREELVNLRQAYLDELERRHPGEFTEWLDSGAGPLSDPSRFLRGRPSSGERGLTEGPDLQAS
jgi:hypothetical protein